MRKFSALGEAILVGISISLIKLKIGAAYLTKNKAEDGKEYIAKKIFLGQLENKE
jgi:hypothetical protein